MQLAFVSCLHIGSGPVKSHCSRLRSATSPTVPTACRWAVVSSMGSSCFRDEIASPESFAMSSTAAPVSLARDWSQSIWLTCSCSRF